MGKEFISTGSKIVFKLALPAMVFSKMIQLENIPDEMLGAILIFCYCNLSDLYHRMADLRGCRRRFTERLSRVQ